ncbi:M48 family metalloprotease [Ignisphaera cupida]|uniref:M48 family metalloprotease n=1 Tax=Ignisphaera cupida TaxID=3050454 RepID=UPI003306FC08
MSKAISYLEWLRRFIRFKLWWLKAKPLNDEGIAKLSTSIALKIGIKPFKYIKEANAPFYNAVVFGLRCRTIIITKALHNLSWDYIEAVLLHEYAHCKLKHSIKITITASMLLSILTGITIYELQFLSTIADAMILMMVFVFAYISIHMLLKYITRKFELEADLFAISNTSNPCSYLKLLAFLGQWEKNKEDLISKLLATHPLARTRIKNILKKFPYFMKCFEQDYGGPGGI